ncbi:MAG: flagellar assembly protein T N-terminal domain-containing protein [Deltaproteobacteria bacterium]|nr:flagellar assembly protein T N-terminal domain-containing protein [Deltaproteobacteria bacterium]
MGRYLFLSFFILLLFFSISVYAQDKSGLLNIDVEGQAVIYQNNVVLARKEAVQNALENAVLKAVSIILSIPVKDEKIQPVKNVIAGGPNKYISIYKILTEKKEKQTYIVNVNAVVILAVLKNDLHKTGLVQPSLTEKDSLTGTYNKRRGCVGHYTER